MAANVVGDVRENLELQLSEVEMLRSMYPEENELKIDDQVLIDIQEFCSRRTNKTPNGLNFLLTVTVDCDSERYLIELFPLHVMHMAVGFFWERLDDPLSGTSRASVNYN